MEMNDTTGLPELPEGQWWHVGHNEAYKGIYGEFFLEIQTWVTERQTRGFFYTIAYFWNDLGMGATAAKWGRKEKVVRALYKEYILDEHRRPELTPTTILATAMKILAGIESEREQERLQEEAQARIDKYLGDYPPNSLKGKS